MNLRPLLVSSAVLGLLAAGDAAGQSLSLQIDKGLVTLDAESVTVDEILARWSRLTGLNVISKSGQGSDIPVSIHVAGVPEREALRMVLRDLSGYIMGERRDPVTGLVTIDRVMILTQSAAQPGPVGGPSEPVNPRPRLPFVRARAAAPTPPAAEPPVVEEAPVADETPVELAPIPEGRDDVEP